jgi:para-nitrobenzyl esterase
VGSANELVLQSGAFAANGVLEVSVNYRLGALGFLQLNNGSPAHRGLLDQIAALEWVRDNIAAFGGDPTRVTLAGRSAGGFAVATLMAMPQAKGLFAKAMPQSGASVAVLTPETADMVTKRFLARLGVTEAELVDVRIEDLLRAQKDICDTSYNSHDFARDGSVTMLGVPFQPVIDGTTLPEHPDLAAANGRTARVPMMIGCTTAEYLTHSTVQPEMDFALAAKLLDPRVRPVGLTGEEIVSRYCQHLPDHTPRGIWRAVAGDLVFQNPTTRFAALHARHQRVYKYLFGPIDADELGAAHGAEVGEVWYRDGMDTSGLPPRQAIGNVSNAQVVHALWTSFIVDSTPVLPANLAWPTYQSGNPILAHICGGHVAIEPDPFAERVSLWASGRTML